MSTPTGRAALAIGQHAVHVGKSIPVHIRYVISKCMQSVHALKLLA